MAWSSAALVRPRIDEREFVPRLDVLSLGEGNLGQLAVHAGPDRDRVEGLHAAEAVEKDGHIALLDLGRHHRNDRPGRHGAAAASAGGSAACGGGAPRFDNRPDNEEKQDRDPGKNVLLIMEESGRSPIRFDRATRTGLTFTS